MFVFLYFILDNVGFLNVVLTITAIFDFDTGECDKNECQ